jgi:hypothetical protein
MLNVFYLPDKALPGLSKNLYLNYVTDMKNFDKSEHKFERIIRTNNSFV